MTDFQFYTEEHINKLQTYIEENFTLDALSKQLVRNILDYVAVQSDDEELILSMLISLLDGIGITSDEIVQAVTQK